MSKDLKRQPWLWAAGLGLVAAAALALVGNFDGAFVAAALGVLAWFLNVRARLRPRYDEGPHAAGEDDDERA